MRVVAKYLVLFIALIATFIVFAIGAYVMPDSKIHRHVKQTIERGDMNSDQPRAILPKLQCRMDNFSDAIILNQAYVMRDEGLTGILSVPRWDEEKLPYEVLKDGVEGEELETVHYARYWHGNTFLARYLLVLYDYISIRFLLYIITSILLVWCAAILWLKGGWQIALATMFSIFTPYAFVMQFSLQLAMVMILALIGIILIAKGFQRNLAFLIIGSLTCFFDLLTAPVLTLGMMLIVRAALYPEDQFWKGWMYSCKEGLIWLVGYGGTWFSKWAIASVFTRENVIADGIKNILNRSSSSDYSRWDAVVANIGLIPWNFVMVAVVIIFVLALLHFKRNGWQKALQILPLAVIPWMWYFFAANHSYLHNWFTFRAQSVSIAAITIAMMQMVEWNEIGNNNKWRRIKNRQI